MEFKYTDRLLKLRFLCKYRKAIKAVYLKHTPKTGYVFIRANHYFSAAGKTRFIERSFDESQFISLHEQEATDEQTAADGAFFKRNMDITLKDYINQCRQTLIESRLQSGDYTMKEIAYDFGFTDESHLNKLFKKHRGMSPSEFRRKCLTT